MNRYCTVIIFSVGQCVLVEDILIQKKDLMSTLGGVMIAGNSPRKIKKYLFIDHCAENCSYVTPEDGEEIWGVPYQFQSDQSLPYIEHRKGGIVVQTVNALDVSVIIFDV